MNAVGWRRSGPLFLLDELGVQYTRPGGRGSTAGDVCLISVIEPED